MQFVSILLQVNNIFGRLLWSEESAEDNTGASQVFTKELDVVVTKLARSHASMNPLGSLI